MKIVENNQKSFAESASDALRNVLQEMYEQDIEKFHIKMDIFKLYDSPYDKIFEHPMVLIAIVEKYDWFLKHTNFHKSEPKEFKKMSIAAIIRNDVNIIHNEILPHYFEKCDKNFIDVMIECSIDNEYPEIRVMLMDFKYKHNLFTEKNWEL